jgi:hypothetical protein
MPRQSQILNIGKFLERGIDNEIWQIFGFFMHIGSFGLSNE